MNRTLIIPKESLRFRRLPQWIASTGPVVGVREFPGSKSGQDILFLSSFIRPSLPSHKDTRFVRVKVSCSEVFGR